MKNKIKYLFVLVLLLVGVFGITNKVVYADETNEEVATTTASESDRTKMNLYMFRGEGCGYCAKALEWFEEIQDTEGKYFNLVTYEVWNDEENKALMTKVANYMGDDVSGVPYIIVGSKSFQGFDDSYKEEILKLVHDEYNKNLDERFDVIENINAGKDKQKDSIITYIICGLILALLVFVFVARNKSGDEDSVNFEYDEKKEEEFDDPAREEEKKDEEVVVEKVREKAKPKTATKKTTNSKKTTSSAKKAGEAKKSTGKRGRPAKK
jgi:glutaredoxin